MHERQGLATTASGVRLVEGESPSGPLSSISAPTLIIHGTADPMFPVEHGQALAHEIPDARLLRLEGAGQGSTPQTKRRSPPRPSTTPSQPIAPDEGESDRGAPCAEREHYARCVSFRTSSATERSRSSRLACSTDLMPSLRLTQALISR
jgi:fermentation-respiration switch protein FrsA (DUF1100 family)